MLTLMTLATASAATTSVCSTSSGSIESGSPACACVRLALSSAGRSGPYWLGGVTWDPASGYGVPAGASCFDYGAVSATVSGTSAPKIRSMLEIAGYDVAGGAAASWLPDPVPGASGLMADMMEEVDRTSPTVFVPVSLDLWEARDPQSGLPTGLLVRSSVPPVGALVDDFEMTQPFYFGLLIALADGRLLEVSEGYTPFVPVDLNGAW